MKRSLRFFGMFFSGAYDEMEPDMAEKLRAFYEPHNKLLRRVLRGVENVGGRFTWAKARVAVK